MKNNKLFKKLVSFAMAAVLIAGGMTGFTTAKAAEITDEEAVVSEIESDVARAAITISFNTPTTQNYGRFIASKSRASITFWGCTTGWARVDIHSGSYSGPVVGNVVIPYGSSPQQTVSISTTVGSTYYITVKPCNDYIQAIGSFNIDY